MSGRDATRRLGAFLIVGFEGTVLTAAERDVLRRVRPGGVILFQRNVESAEQLLALGAELRAAAPEALLYVDAEGGRVDRLRGIVGGAPAGRDLAAAPPAFAERAGRWVGATLRHFGFAVDLAPVVDLDRGLTDNALDGRYLGATPRAVAARARRFLAGLEAMGVAGCCKHFPGLGAARMDTHRDGAPIALSAAELARDLAPFAALARECDMVMASHASYPALDGEGRPATLSPPIATDLLRRRLRFRGVLVSDDLEMGALAPWGDLAQRSVAAFAAGCDLLPICRNLAAVPDVVGALAGARLAERAAVAEARVLRWRKRQALLARAAAKRRAPDLEEIRRGLAALARALAVRVGGPRSGRSS